MSDELVERVADAIEYVPSYIPIRKQRLLEARAALRAIEEAGYVIISVEAFAQMQAGPLPDGAEIISGPGWPDVAAKDDTT